jgi:hypothetical protein
MDLVSCRLAYKAMASSIFKKGALGNWGSDYVYAAFGKPWFSGDTLKAAIQEVVSERLSIREKEALDSGRIEPFEARLGGIQETNCKT